MSVNIHEDPPGSGIWKGSNEQEYVRREARDAAIDTLAAERERADKAERERAAIDRLRLEALQEVERLKASNQRMVDAACHYRNLSIKLGAEPDQMLDVYDRKLCMSGLGDADLHMDQLADAWSEVDRLKAHLSMVCAEWNKTIQELNDTREKAQKEEAYLRKCLERATSALERM